MALNLEAIIFGNLQLEQEMLRIIVALAGLIIFSWFDLFNNRNIPNNLLYLFLGISVLVNLAYSSNTLEFSLLVSLLIALVSYIFYRAGQIGGADALVLVSISQLLPIHPSFLNLSFNFPFIFSTFLFSGFLFIIYFISYFLVRVIKEQSPANSLYLLLSIPYLAFSYFYINSPIFFPFYFLILSLSFISIIFFYTYKDSISKMLIEEVPLKDVQEEEILAIDFMDQTIIKKFNIQRLVTKKEIEKLKKSKLKKIFVYTKLPPFIPFILFGFILALLFSNYLLLS